MTNGERFKNEIRALKRPALTEYESSVFGITKDTSEIKACTDMQADCICINNCIFYNEDGISLCTINRMKWIFSEYENPIVLTQEEKDFSRGMLDVYTLIDDLAKVGAELKKEYAYLCRKEDNKIYFMDIHNQIETEMEFLDEKYNLGFNFIKRGEKYPLIDLANCKVK